MAKKHITYLFGYIALLCSSQWLTSQDSSILIGEEDLWNKVIINELDTTDGKRGFIDLKYTPSLNIPDSDDDLNLSLEKSQAWDETGNYSIVENPLFTYSSSAEKNVALFNGNNKMRLRAGKNSLFDKATLWNDFTLEFRIFPSTLKEGATIFLWKGLERRSGLFVSQEIRCTISDRKLIWDFENFFSTPDSTLKRYSLVGDKLLPQKWSKHTIRFNSKTGLLEYLIDDIPVDNTYTSKSRKEEGEYNLPRTGDQESFQIELGNDYTGLIDYFKIKNRLLPFINPAPENTPFIETGIINLETTNANLLRINSQYYPSDGQRLIFLYSQSNDLESIYNEKEDWHYFTPAEELKTIGQYLKIRVEFETIGDYQRGSSILSNLNVEYRKVMKSSPPSDILGNWDKDKMILTWKKGFDPQIKGYKIYIGTSSSLYLVRREPIDTGDQNSFIIEGLNPDKDYYIAMTSYKFDNHSFESDYSSAIIVPAQR